MLCVHLNAKMKFEMAEDVFADLARSVEIFKGLDYDVIGESGAQIKVKQTVPA